MVQNVKIVKLVVKLVWIQLLIANNVWINFISKMILVMLVNIPV